MRTYKADNTCITPHSIIYRGRCHDLFWVHDSFKIKGFHIYTDDKNIIKDVKLFHCFHPNALEHDLKIHGIRHTNIECTPEFVYLCLPQEIIGKKLKDEIPVSAIINLMEIWNFNDCYYYPQSNHYTAHPTVFI